MANLKEIRGRITSVNSTMQITSAMKMVSAAKLRRAQDAIIQIRPYAEKLQAILANVNATLDSSESIYSSERKIKNVVLIAITSNRGLCGGFNNNIIKETKKLALNDYKDCNVSVIPIGKKAEDAFKATEWSIMGLNMPKHLSNIYANLDYEHVAPIAQKFMDLYADKSIDKVILVYNKFKNAAVQILSKEQFLPVPPPANDDSNQINMDYIFEPNKSDIARELIPKTLKVQFFKALLDSHAAEHGARMTAMHQATDNATELVKELKLTYNKARQTAITNEILEIVGGAEALNN